MSDSSLVTSPLVGEAGSPGNTFDDNTKFPNILKISKIQFLWPESEFAFPIITGLRITYVVMDGIYQGKPVTTTVDVVHGSGVPGPQEPLKLGDNQFAVGIFGIIEGENKSITAGAIRSLGILVYDTSDGVSTYNSVPPKHKGGPGPSVELASFAFLGLIRAFGGIVSSDSNGSLEALCVYYKPGDVPGIAA